MQKVFGVKHNRFDKFKSLRAEKSLNFKHEPVKPRTELDEQSKHMLSSSSIRPDDQKIRDLYNVKRPKEGMIKGPL